MKHCFKKLMALLLATLMVMSAFSTIGAVAADSVCTHEGTWQKWVLEGEDESSATKAPTCEEPGYTYYKCTACGKVDAKDFVPATGHSYKWFADSVDGVACGDLYAIYEACEKCNKVRDWDPTPDGSNPVYNGQGTVIAPDNDPTPGYKTHNYDHYEIVTYPTCATHGELELICTHGGDCPRISVLIKRLSNDGQHTFDGSVVIEKKDATCTEDGFQLEACAKCYLETYKKDGLADEDKVTHEHNKDCGCPNAAATYAAKGHSYAAAKAAFLAADVKSLTDADFDAADSCNRTFTCTVCETSETLTKHRDWKTENKYGATPAANACYQVKWCAHCETEDATTIVNLHNSKNAYDCNSRNVVKGDVKVGNHPTEKDKQACYVEYSCVECGYEWVELADHLAAYPNAPEHGSLHVTVAKDPTCTKYGTTIYSCDDCGLLIAEMTNPLGHEWDEENGKQTDATCSTPGGLAVKCVRYSECGATETLNPVDPLGHQWVRDEANDVDHTCMTWGLTAYKCTRPTGIDTVCGQTKFEKTTPPDGKSHSKDMYTVTTFPTCTEYGVATLFCKLCDMADSVTITWADRENPEYAYFNFDLIKVLGHDDNVVEVPATCSQPGYRKGQCTRPGCNYYVDEVIPVAGGAKGHHFELVADQNGDIAFDADGKAMTVPTVGYYEGGFKVETDATDENAIQGADGKYYKYYLRFANCGEAALLWRQCTQCKYTWTEQEGSKFGHDHDTNKTLVTPEDPASCHKDGTTAVYYVVCENSFYEIFKYTGVEDKAAGKLYLVKPDGTKVELGGVIEYTTHDAAIDTHGKLTVTEKTVTVDTAAWTLDELGFLRDANGYFVYYLSLIPCDFEGEVGGENIPSDLVHDWEILGPNGEAATRPARNDGVNAPAEGKAPTCTDVGYKPYWRCSTCGAFRVVNGVEENGAEIPALNHSMTTVEAKDPTCTEGGNKEYEKCTRCTYNTADNKTFINALGHDPKPMDKANYCGDIEHIKAPTCAENGVGYGAICARCGDCAGMQYHYVINKLSHNFVNVTHRTGVTCTDEYFSLEFCTICGHAGICARADEAGFEEEIPACSKKDSSISFVDERLGDVDSVNLFAGKFNESGYYEYSAFELTYFFAEDKDVEKLFAAKDAECKFVLKSGNKIVGSQPITYVVGEKNAVTVSIDLTYVYNSACTYEIVASNAKMLDAEGSFILKAVSEKKYGCREITDFAYWTSHTEKENCKQALSSDDQAIIDSLAANKKDAGYDCLGYYKYTGCENCDAVLSEKTRVEPKGHVLPDHKNPANDDEKFFIENNATASCAHCGKTGLDIHEGKYDHVVVGTPKYEYENETTHIKSTYVITSCTECKYRNVQPNAVVREGHDHTYDYRVETEASLTAPGVGYGICVCGDEKKESIPQLSGTFLDLEFNNANKPGAGFTDSSIVAVTVKLSAADIAIWGINFKLTYDARYVEYLDGEEVWNSGDFKYGNSAVDVENTFAANHTGAKTNWVIVTAQAPNSADSKTQNIVVSGEQAFVTLYFKVNTPNAVVDDPATTENEGVVFGFQNVDVVNNGFVQKVDEDGELVFKADGVTPEYIPQKVVTTATGASIAVKKYMDHTGEGTVDLLDCLAAYQIYSGEILVPGDYSVTIDVNKDGVVDLLDFESIYAYISGNMSYEEIRNLTA